MDGERSRRTHPHVQRPEPGAEHQRGDHALVGQLGEEDDTEGDRGHGEAHSEVPGVLSAIRASLAVGPGTTSVMITTRPVPLDLRHDEA